MIVIINDRYRIESEPHCWVVQECRGRRKDTGEKRWIPVGYYSRFENALEELSHRRIRLIENSVPADEIVSMLKTIREEAISALDLFQKRVTEGDRG